MWPRLVAVRFADPSTSQTPRTADLMPASQPALADVAPTVATPDVQHVPRVVVVAARRLCFGGMELSTGAADEIADGERGAAHRQTARSLPRDRRPTKSPTGENLIG